jgi:hypothetical protein
MFRPPGHAGKRKPGGGRLARQAAAWLVPALLAVSASGCGAQPGASRDAAPGPGPGCRVGRPVMLAGLPGFVTMLRQDFAQAPGDLGVRGHPNWDITQYVCGEGSGFIADDIMYGKYRAQDNALARSLGYRVGKFPLVPYIGTAVTALPRKAFETYEVVLQFRSAKAAADWLNSGQQSPAPHGRLTAASLPHTFTAEAGMAGPNDGRHEHRIAVTGRVGAVVIALSIAGGQDLAWPDVRPIWASAYRRLTQYLI